MFVIMQVSKSESVQVCKRCLCKCLTSATLQVNLGHSAELCANLTQPEYNLTQTQTQEYVAGVQVNQYSKHPSLILLID